MKAYSIPAVFFFILLCIYPSFVSSSDMETNTLADTQQELMKIAQVNLEETSLAQIDVLVLQVQGYIVQGKNCVYLADQELEQIDKALAALGEKVTGETKDISKERGSLQALKNKAEIRRAQCRLLILKASDLDQKLNENKKQVFTRDLFSQGPGFFEIVRRPEINLSEWIQLVTVFLMLDSGLGFLAPYHFVLIVLLVGLGFFLGSRVDTLFFRNAGQIQQEGFFFDFWRMLSRRRKTFQLLGTLIGISLSLHFIMKGLQPPPYLPSVVNSILLILILSTFGKFYGQLLSGKQGDSSVVKGSTPKQLQFHLLAILSGLLWFIFTSPLSIVLPETAFFLIRALIVTLWYGLLLRVFWLFCGFSRFQGRRRSIRLVLILMFGIVIIAELIGYRALASHFLAGTSGTVVLVFLLSLCLFLISEVVGGLGRGKYLWQQTIRKKAEIEETHVLKGLVWAGSLLKVSLVIVFLYLILRLWGISRIYASAIYDWLVEGFSFGSITVVPFSVALGFLILAIGWSVVSLVKNKIIRRWLAESELAPSIQDALSTVIGYVSYSLIILFGLSTAGINFSGLAIVAGALSVGIGFGLQNIVNNLVSGLILLFERPIKRGDWVVVGTTEGYVKKISVRSTIIQTFDRSDVIVPNSELISSQVTNMMLMDIRGRVRMAVGVAYGSDTELVKQLLLEVAQKHPEVITNGTAPSPIVRFHAFGDSSLDFELLCHLKDVDKRFDVRSDMHFAIDKAFRKHGIQIPFPQRDIHIKSGFLDKNPNQ
ncbi:MAG: mechanosensitive ion channel [Desulfocapsa sp.]|nr:mechanosensitive ion channel [Desulfocapsa sp.]